MVTHSMSLLPLCLWRGGVESLLCDVLPSVLSSFTSILLRKKELVALFHYIYIFEASL